MVAIGDRSRSAAVRSPAVLIALGLFLGFAMVALSGGRSSTGRAHAASAAQVDSSRATPAAVAVTHAVRVEGPVFWYEEGARCADLERWSLPCAPRGSGARVAEAVAIVLHDHPHDFPQPPPLDVVVRARAPEGTPGTLQSLADVYTYGGADLVDGVVYIDVNLTAFIGETPLNDAELRSFLAHEFKHAYQYADGPVAKNSPELWRREVEAHEWELLNMDLGVRSWYRAEAIFNLEMYRRLLAGD